ncbi:MAG: phosphatase PAP2 family protein [Alistipes sp.]|nr:phosphatase PAP2 family protein [Alistipes sp.]
MYTFDYPLFLALNFDGGVVMDKIMVLFSTPLFWVWLYLIMLWLVGRKYSWRGVLLFLVAAAVAAGISDMVAGIFKHTGLLKNLWSDFPARLRPMHTPELEGLIHVVKQGGKYGTVSAHAATMFSVLILSTTTIRRAWFGWMMALAVVAICYSRIYLAYHFPMDILLGALIGSVAGGVASLLFNFAIKLIRKH